MRTALGYLLAMLVIAALCGMAMLVTGRDNECTEQGGSLHGRVGQECRL